MMASRHMGLVFLALTLGAVSIAAQQKGGCEVKLEGKLKSAQLAMTKAQFGSPDAQRAQMREAVKQITQSPEKDSAARNYLLAQVYAWWLTKGNAPAVAKRTDLGFTGSADETMNVAASFDSSVTALETAMPQCAADAQALRQQAWAPSITVAGTLINLGQLDSAKVLLARAQLLNPRSPYTAYYSAVAAQNSKDFPGAASWYRKTVELITPELSAKDTALNTIRRQALYSSGVFARAVAEQGPPAERQARLTEAATAFKSYVEAYPQGENVADARTALSTLLQSAGDTAAAAQTCTQAGSNPGAYGYMQLFELGANCFNANRKPDAAKLFEAGLAQNPYYRDALYNLANTYLALQDRQRMFPVVQRLVAVDPSYPDNWRLLAAAHQLTAKQIDAELKSIAKDAKQQTRAAALRKELKAANDSVLKYYNMFHEAPARLTVTGFQHTGSQHVLTGSIENLTDKPATYTLRVEFLDVKGNVVTTQNATVAAGPKATQSFRLEARGDGIAAYRYSPIA